ncbi:hypothetical protein K443DRAFT_82365 [Laccaria amethystina LaAM-08-1]|uniref:Uncharacterized protein n=1 Tax=Laccaria amethystina LaAM-08-1 TaxID=1095629 RepID=A0A0C9XWM3_9AGAR|nr:hypothetical protein K443DRAFT_82365 [Laccaria amethystina LaAM-08-1]
MCKHEIIGDFYRGCGHFHGKYYTGETMDCGSDCCKSSNSHKHKTANKCSCPEIVIEERRVQNLYQTHHADCQRTSR